MTENLRLDPTANAASSLGEFFQPQARLILIVDDVPANLKVLRGLLAGQYRLTFASNGHQALDRVQSSQPDLILLDLMMPGMDGLEVCRRLKQAPNTAKIPIIFLTASHETENLLQAFEQGAVDYVTKPFQSSELLARIKTQLELTYLKQQLANTVQQLQDANQELTQLSKLDELTQVANRRFFNEYLQQEWRRLRREEDPLSLILIDLDCFKEYNDTYGHLQGDICLQAVAKTLSQVIRRPADLIARYGGEEFVVVLSNTNTQGAAKVAERMQQAIAQLDLVHAAHPSSSHVTISAGIATTVPRVKSSWQDLLAQADTALYAAKAEGRDRYCMASNHEIVES
ncbi:PleD family two-component system response regulator [Sphaerothrix gracilis]|uniref:PleD family two-component system response regulator n=1 Tax=Sphaerothrix gracilis TaxID=3151835 RepID=UPI0031FBFF75